MLYEVITREKGLSDKPEIPVGTAAGAITLKQLPDDRVEVDMGVPVLEPASIPFDAAQRALTYPLEVDGVRNNFV